MTPSQKNEKALVALHRALNGNLTKIQIFRHISEAIAALSQPTTLVQNTDQVSGEDSFVRDIKFPSHLNDGTALGLLIALAITGKIEYMKDWSLADIHAVSKLVVNHMESRKNEDL